MKEELRIDIVGLAGACSYALDCIEAELVKIKNKHGKRVAYISVCMAEYLAIQGDALQDLAMCALLHDNALTQYITEELERNYVIDIKKDLSVRKTNLHCIYGEKNITKPAKLEILSGRNRAYITITEGKYHQVKRMFQAIGLTVTFLKRISMGSLILDKNLKSGGYRKLTEEEISNLKSN